MGKKKVLQIGGGKILLLLFFALICGGLRGETYSHIFEANPWSALGTKELGGVSWNLSGKMNDTYPSLGLDLSKGVQLGSANNPFTKVNLSTEDIAGKITAVTVETSGASNINATFQVKVGGVSYLLDNGKTEQTLTNKNTAYTFSGTSAGKVELIWTNSSAKAIYVRSITMTYGDGMQKVSPVVFSHKDGMVSEEPFVLTASCPTEGATIYYTQSNSGEPETPSSASTVFPENGVNIDRTTTIKAVAIADGCADSDVTTATFLIGKTPEIKWSATSFSVDMTDENVTFPVLSNNSDGVVSYTSSDESVAKISENGLITIQGAGTTNITASVAATETFFAAQASYTLTVVDNGQPAYSALVAKRDDVYYAMTTSSETGADRLDALKVYVLNDKVIKEDWTKDIAWTVDRSAGTIVTKDGKYVSHVSGSGITLKTSKYVWKWNSGTQYWNCTTHNEEGRSLGLYGISYFRAYETSSSEPSAIAMPFTDGYVRDVAGASAETPKYGTICLPNDVRAGDFSGAEFYSVLGKVLTDGEVTAVALSAPLTELEAGKPYIFSATSGNVLVVYTGEAVATPGSDNGLIGSLNEQVDVPEGKFLMSGNKIHVCGTGCYIGPNRAYVDFDQMQEYVPTAEVNARLISFGHATAVDEIKAEGKGATDVYTVSGVCIRRQVEPAKATCGLAKGIYIVDGQKTVVQ